MKLLTNAIISAVAIQVFVLCVSACTFRAEPLPAFNRNEYIFIGTVTGYTQPVPIPNRKVNVVTNEPGSWLDARGIVVRVKEAVYLPESAKNDFEVFEFFYTGACEPLGLTQEIIENRYPVGNDVIVIGQPSKFLPLNSTIGRRQLEVRGGLILPLKFFDSTRLPNRDSVANYRELREEKERSGIYYSFYQFEMRKDLLRLENARDVNEKRAVLSRLIYLPNWYRRLDLFTIIRNNIPNEKEADELYLKALHDAGYPEEKIQVHLKCLQNELASGKYVPGKVRC